MFTHRHNRLDVHDVVVVGARAAGAATALLLARQGLDVVLVDRAEFPSDTVSTHLINRPGVVQLHRWGLLPAVLASGTPALRRSTITVAGQSKTYEIDDVAGVDVLVAPRRYVLDALLVEEAAAAGVTVRTGVTVDAVRRDATGRVTGVRGRHSSGVPIEVRARYVVGADGMRSRIARAVGAPVVDRRADGGAAQYAYFAGIEWDGIELISAEGSFSGVFPTHNGEACIWICGPTEHAHEHRRRAATRAGAFTEYLGRTAPGVARRLRGARRTSEITGMLRMPNFVRAAHGPGWALVGDAGLQRDAVTGHGISDAFRDAELLALALGRALREEAPERHALADYRRDRDALSAEIFDLTCAISGYPALPQFVELQKLLGKAVEAEALALAERPLLAGVPWSST